MFPRAPTPGRRGTWDEPPAEWSFGHRVMENPRYADRTFDRLDGPRAPIALEAQVASWHQKFVVVDGEVAYVSGFNTKGTDWDTSDHLVFDPNRMELDASMGDREEVAAGLLFPDFGPRKDDGVRVEGPAVAVVENIFWERWESGIDNDSLYAENATSFSRSPAPDEPRTGVMAQVVATMPAPWSEQSIAETHARALSNATEYIFIEDQYFRSPMMYEAILDALDENPDLVLVVITMPVSAYDGGARYTWETHHAMRSAFGERYRLLQLRTRALVLDEGLFWDEAWVEAEPIFTHSKLRIVDDRYLSVGSCNFNNRGYKYEGELNVSVLDDGFTQRARDRIFSNLVGAEWASWLSDDSQNNLDVMALAAEANLERERWWDDNARDLSLDEASDEWQRSAPSGFLYPLEIEDDYWFDVGPDAF